MTSGKPFTAEERAYIADHAYTMSWGRIADELAVRYPEAGGHPLAALASSVGTVILAVGRRCKES